jgi:hypothetical protein
VTIAGVAHRPAEPSANDQRYSQAQSGKAKAPVAPPPPTAEAATEAERTKLKGKFEATVQKVSGFGGILNHIMKSGGAAEVTETLATLEAVLKKLTSAPHNIPLTELTGGVDAGVTEQLKEFGQPWNVLAGQGA